MLKMENVNHNGQFLQSLNMVFRNNEFVGIYGDQHEHLLRILAGIEFYDQGDLQWNGYSTKNFTKQQWNLYRKTIIGWVSPRSGTETIYETVEMGLIFQNEKSCIKQRKIKNALCQVGIITGHERRLMDLCQEDQFRVALATELVKQPQIVLCTKIPNDFSLFHLLQELADDYLVIAFMEDENYARLFDRRVYFEENKVIFDSHPSNACEINKGTYVLEDASLSLKSIHQLVLKGWKEKKWLVLCFVFPFVAYLFKHSFLLSLLLVSGVYLFSQTEQMKALRQMGASFKDLLLLLNGFSGWMVFCSSLMALFVKSARIESFLILMLGRWMINATLLYFVVERDMFLKISK